MFYDGLDRRKLLTILGICLVFGLLLTGEFQVILLTLPGVIIAMTFHEYAHAWVADKLGDTTPRAQGRLTLNPLSHIDPFGIILLLFANIGWGKPVQINPRNFNSNRSMETCEALVSLAGPLVNLILAFVLMVVYYALDIFTSCPIIILLIVYYAIVVNIGLGVFNLLPIPPLDGSKIFAKFLPYNAKAWIDRNMQYIYIVFLILWITGVLSWIVSPVITFVFDGMSWIVSRIFLLFL